MFIIGITGVSTPVSSWTTFIVVIFIETPVDDRRIWFVCFGWPRLTVGQIFLRRRIRRWTIHIMDIYFTV